MYFGTIYFKCIDHLKVNMSFYSGRNVNYITNGNFQSGQNRIDLSYTHLYCTIVNKTLCMCTAFVITSERRHERLTEGSLFNYLSLTLFVISVDLLSGSKKWIEERLTTQMSVCGEVSANSIWFASSLKDNHKLNPPSRKRLMNGINNDATLYIEAYGFTACFPRVYVPCACERREGEKGHF